MKSNVERDEESIVVSDGKRMICVRVGDVIRVVYHEAPTALMKVTRVNRHSFHGLDGEWQCKVTVVSDTELRFYGSLGPNRQTVLRNVRLQKIGG